MDQLSCGPFPNGPNRSRRTFGRCIVFIPCVWARKRWMPMTSLAVNVEYMWARRSVSG